MSLLLHSLILCIHIINGSTEEQILWSSPNQHVSNHISLKCLRSGATLFLEFAFHSFYTITLFRNKKKTSTQEQLTLDSGTKKITPEADLAHLNIDSFFFIYSQEILGNSLNLKILPVRQLSFSKMNLTTSTRIYKQPILNFLILIHIICFLVQQSDRSINFLSEHLFIHKYKQESSMPG